MRRVVIGDFGMVARMGLVELLDEEGLEVVAETGGPYTDGPSTDGRGTEAAPAGLIPRVSEVRPDAVVLDLDHEDTEALAAEIASAFPAIKVVACSSAQPVMRVFPPFHHGESYVSPLSPALLVTALES